MPRADSLLAATRCGRATEWLGLPPFNVISVAQAGLDTGKRFSVGCRVLRGFLACVSSAIAARPDRARALSRGRNLGLSPLLGRSAVATGLPKGVKGMALALRAALTWRTTRVLLLATSTLNFRVAKRCRDMSRGAHSRPRRPATANRANRPTPEKPELCSCLLSRQLHAAGSTLS